jgi:hypothetical protein
MPMQDNLVFIERLVFVCRNLEGLFQNQVWKNFLLSPLRQTRRFVQSRYLVFRNVMLEFLEVTDERQGDKFVFFDEWKKSKNPTWVGIGIKVPDLDNTIFSCKKYNKNIIGKFTSESNDYSKRFKHQSALMDFKVQNRQIYFTEYDPQFERDRNHALFGTIDKRRKTPTIILPPINLAKETSYELLKIDDHNRICLHIKSDVKVNFLELDWISISSDKSYD